MKTTNNYNKKNSLLKSINIQSARSVVFSILIVLGFLSPLSAQDITYLRPSWRFGVAGGANLNFYRGSTQKLNSDFTVPAIFHDGNGIGLYVAPLVEYHKPGTLLGIMLQAGYDSRKGAFDQIYTPCNCPADLLFNLNYLTLEPSLRFAPFRSSFNIFAGPRFAMNLTKDFNYKQGINPAFPNQIVSPEKEGDMSDMNKYLVSMQVGAGFDIPLSSVKNNTQILFSPFISYHPYIGQNPRSIETLNITTFRVGAAIKFGRGHRVTKSDRSTITSVVSEPLVNFTVFSPSNVPLQRKMRETFPIRNYIYFDKESTTLKNRYVLLSRNQVKEFKEEQLEVNSPKDLNGRSKRQMIAYYNVLNILGDRMGKNPSSTINLVGSSENGPQEGIMMGESVKKYIVDIFGINPSRITIEGRDKPKIPSEQPGGTRDLDLLREGDRRVSIESTSPSLLMEFQSGTANYLKPVELKSIQDAPIDSYTIFNVEGGNEAFSSWSMEIKDKNNLVQYFGPYTRESVSIPGKTILGKMTEGDYKVTMIGVKKDGKLVRQEVPIHLKLWEPPVDEEGLRYSIIYEFDDSKAISIYEKYLTDVVSPKIPKNGKVIIHGHTDVIGSEVNNQKLSEARSNDVKAILLKSLANQNRSDVKFEVYAFGENQEIAPFDNDSPEERAYNRAVIIDIIPPSSN